MTASGFPAKTLAVAAVFAVAPLPAVAVGDERVELFAEQAITRDDNVFRLAEEVDPETIIGTPVRYDTYFTTEVGIALDLPVSRQRLVGEVALDRARFDRFDSLDLDGHHADLTWEWVYGDRLSGHLSWADAERLASLANVQAGEQTNVANFLTVRSVGADLRYKLTERWYLSAGHESLRHDNSAEVNQLSDMRRRATSLGIEYVTRAGTTLGVERVVHDADLPNLQALGGQLIDNSYRQSLHTVRLEWPASAATGILARAGRVTREHDRLPERDYSGGVFELSWAWQPTDKLTLTASTRRGISPYEQVNVGFVLLESLTFRSHWRISEKLSLELGAIDGDRRYLGDPRLALTDVPSRTEDVGLLELDLRYEATDVVALFFELRRNIRETPVALGDYQADIATFGIRATF